MDEFFFSFLFLLFLKCCAQNFFCFVVLANVLPISRGFFKRAHCENVNYILSHRLDICRIHCAYFLHFFRFKILLHSAVVAFLTF
jgi:hypothetical protein